MLKLKIADVVFGVMADKDIETMLDIIAPITKKLYAVTVDNPRSMKSGELCELAKKHGIKAVDALDPGTAIKLTTDKKLTLILGSLYMYPAVKEDF